MARLDPRTNAEGFARLVLAVAMVVAAGVLLQVGDGQLVRGDELDYASRLATQPLGHALLHSPPDKYLIAVPLLVYDAMFNLFGLGADLPYRVVTMALVLTCAGLLFALVRRRVGPLVALAPAALLLFLGSGWEMVITPLRLPGLIATATGLGAMLALERGDRRGDLMATVLLCVAVASHPLSLAFLAAAGVMVVLRPGAQRWRGLWVLAAPAAIFAGWWLFLRAASTPAVVPTQAIDVVRFVRDSWLEVVGISSGAAKLGDPAFDQLLVKILGLALLLAVAGVAIRLGRRIPSSLVAAFAALIVLFAATRLAPSGYLRQPDEARYLFPAVAIFMWLACEAVGAARNPRAAGIAMTVFVVLGIAYNASLLGDRGDTARLLSATALGAYSADELAGSRANASYRANAFEPSAGQYLAAAGAYGEVGLGARKLLKTSAVTRWAADRELVGVLGIRLRPGASAPISRHAPPVEAGVAPAVAGCRRLSPKPSPGAAGPPMFDLNASATPAQQLRHRARTGEPLPVDLAPQVGELGPLRSGLELSSGRAGDVGVLVKVFADTPRTQLRRSAPARRSRLDLPRIGPGRGVPWYVTLVAAHRLEACAQARSRGSIAP